MTVTQLDSASHPTLLIVEDSPDILMILHRILRNQYPLYSVAMATSGDDALAFAERATLALVLTDYNMQGMDGITLTIELRKHYPALPILMITAYASPELEKQAREAGVTAFISKPFLLDNLLALIGRYVPQEPV